MDVTISGASHDECWVATCTPYYYEEPEPMTAEEMLVAWRRWNSKRRVLARKWDRANEARLKRTARKVGEV